MGEQGSLPPIEGEEGTKIGPPSPAQKGTLPTGQTVSVGATARLMKLIEEVKKGAVIVPAPEGGVKAIEQEDLTEEDKSYLNSQVYEKEITVKTVSLFHEALQSANSKEEIQILDTVAHFLADTVVRVSSKEKILGNLPTQISEVKSQVLEALQEPSLQKEEVTEELTTNKIVEWLKDNWDRICTQEGFPKPLEGRVKAPKGVKYYPDPRTGKVVIDIAGEYIGFGSAKAAKSVIRILPDGSITELVRYTPLKLEGEKTPERQQRFEEEMRGFGKPLSGGELYWREKLREGGQIPETITDIQTITYMGKHGLKTRYFTEKCHGNLWDLINAERGGSYKTLRCIRDTLEGLSFIHKMGIVHFDIKPLNILLKGDRGKITDFGSAMNAGSLPVPHKGYTIGFAAPEVFLQKKISAKADIFSIGVFLLLLFQFPTIDAYKDICAIEEEREKAKTRDEEDEAIQRLKDCIDECRANLFDKSDEFQKLASDCLSWNPEERPSSEEALARLEAILARM